MELNFYYILIVLLNYKFHNIRTLLNYTFLPQNIIMESLNHSDRFKSLLTLDELKSFTFPDSLKCQCGDVIQSISIIGFSNVQGKKILVACKFEHLSINEK